MASFLGKLGRHGRAVWESFRRGGAGAATDHALELLRRRLGVETLEAQVRRATASAAAWAVMSWIEQARFDERELISIILPTHDRSALLARALDSIRAQAYGNWEIVVVDDGSHDDTAQLLGTLSEPIGAHRLQVLRIANSGACAARNRGLEAARGSIIAYLDDDNAMHPLWLKAVAWAFAQRPDVDVVYGGLIVDDVLRINRRDAGEMPSFHLHEFDERAIAQANLADMGAIAHRAGLEGARFDESLREMGDWDLLVRLTRAKPPLVLPAIACFYYTSAPDRLSGGPTFEADAARVRARAR